jgi:NTE family protein
VAGFKKNKKHNQMNQKVALVLSGGGARGTAHIGAIEVLKENNFDITSIAGTSMGSLIGGMYVAGKIDEFKEWICSLDKLKVFSLLDFTLGSNGIIKGDKVFNKIKEYIPDTQIEKLKIPYAAVAANIISKKEVVFTSGNILDAIRASVAIPSVITPVKTNNGLLVDGGVLNNIPINHVARQKGDILVVVNVNADIPVTKPKKKTKKEDDRENTYQTKIGEFYQHLHKTLSFHKDDDNLSYFEFITKTIELMMFKSDQIMLKKYKPDILINIPHESCNIFDFYKAVELIEIGRNAAIQSINAYKKSKK